MSAFGGKADMTFCRCPLSRSLLGVKRTSSAALHMFAFDPKRTFVYPLTRSISRPRLNRYDAHPTGSGLMRRRDFFTTIGVGAIALRSGVTALAKARNVHVGFLTSVPPTPDMLNALREGLRERGYIEGQNLSIDVRWPKESFARDPNVAADLVRSNVDVIIAWTTPAVAAARKATSTIPIVMVGVSNPIELGFIGNLARPGGNITGVSNLASDLSAKLVELLTEITPNANSVGLVCNPSNPAAMLQVPGMEDAARALGLDRESTRLNSS